MNEKARGLTFDELRLASLLASKTADMAPFPVVHVTANDYAYDGWLVSVFQKRAAGKEGAWRCVVEDANKRLFVHNAGQLEFAPDLAHALADMVIRIDRFAASRNIDLAAAIRTRFEPSAS